MKLSLMRQLRVSRITRALKHSLSILNQVTRPALDSLSQCIAEEGIDLVIDVGANVGQFAIDLRVAGYDGEIYSFEPASLPFSNLVKNSSRDSLWSVFNFGLGSINQEVDLNIASNDGLSSSILKPNLHSGFFPSVEFNSTEKIQVLTLSKFIQDMKLEHRRILLKIDAQGAESMILEGAREVFDSVISTYVELSLVELYQGETGALGILNKLSDAGHEISDIKRGAESRFGRLLQIDVVTRRK